MKQSVISILVVLAGVCPVSAQSELPTLDVVKAAGALRSSYRAQARRKTDEVPTANLARFRGEIEPLLLNRCAQCHGADEQEASFRVDTLNPDLIQGDDSVWWSEVMDVLSNGEMPPADQDIALADTDRSKIIDWVSNELQVASRLRRSEQGHSSFRRMTRYEFNYAMQDLLGLPYEFGKDLPPESASDDGFHNSSEMLQMSAIQFEAYRELGRQALLKATVRGKRPKPVHWSLSMDAASEMMLRGYHQQAEKIKQTQLTPEEKEKRLQRLRQTTYSTNPRIARFMNLETGEGVPGRYAYSGANFCWPPSDVSSAVPTASSSILILPPGQRQIFDLGDHLPDAGTLRVRVRACRTTAEGETYPDLRVSFGFQPSNNSRTSFPVGKDLAIQTPPSEPKTYQLDIPLGEISRNSFRGNVPLGQKPNPSEYLVFENLHNDQQLGVIQIFHIEITAPFYDRWPPESHRRVFPAGADLNDETANARNVLSHFMPRAWRRPISASEVDRKLVLFAEVRPECEDFQEAMIEVLATVISSPRFLYLVQAGGKENRLTHFELATRLSMFLWSSIPDEELLRVAAEQRLHDPDILAEQTRRMLADPRAERFSRHFVRQWLNMQLLDYLDVDRETYDGFDERLLHAMQEEPIAVFQHVLNEDHSVMEFLHADYTMANERLAEHYGIPDVYGSHFRRVGLKAEHRRGGLLTQAGLLAMNSDGKDTNPLKRGIWLLERILDDPPPPPPPAVPEIDLTDPEILNMTLKERMEDHRNDPACVSCHSKIDPWGIAFEHFDAVGRWRDTIGKEPVDAAAVLFNQQRLDGVDGLKRYLLEYRQDQFARAMTHKLAAYALGRPLSFADRSEIERITKELRDRGDGLATLIMLIVKSDLFVSK